MWFSSKAMEAAKIERGEWEALPASKVYRGLLHFPVPQAELAAAHRKQRNLLPEDTPQPAGFQITCAWEPSPTVGGDYLDVFTLSPETIALCVGDVSGKGMAAVDLMVKLRRSLLALAPDAEGPAALCAGLNRALCETKSSGQFATFFYGILNTSQQKLQYENAGNCLPLLVRADGEIVMAASYSGVLGLFSHWTYQQSEIALNSGDCLIILTDGVLGATNAKEEEFGYQRLINSVQRSIGLGARAVRNVILDDLLKFCSRKLSGDASFIALTVD